MGEFMEHLAAVVSDQEIDSLNFDLLTKCLETENGYIYFLDDDCCRVVVECAVDHIGVELTERVAACINSCLGVPTDLVEQNTLSDLLAIRHQRDELLALAVRSEFELATCADRGAGDVDHGLIPALRALIAKIKGQDHGG
jgi:hypothetical protein